MQQEALKKLLSSVDSAITKIKSDVLAPKKAGIVRSAKDGIIEIENISGLRMGEVVVIEEIGVEALVLQVGLEVNIAVAMQPSDELRAGLSAVSTGKTLSIKVNDAMIGRIVNPLGVPLDAKPKIENGTAMPLEAIAPGVTARESVSQPVQTGILAIDALIPVGRGQRELIIGDRQTGKTTIALDTIINQKGQNMVCVYVAIGQRDSKTAQVIRTLQEHGAMDYTVVVSASAADPAILQFLAPLFTIFKFLHQLLKLSSLLLQYF
jgi:F-type H+-transporting ATPase subunit alpha